MEKWNNKLKMSIMAKRLAAKRDFWNDFFPMEKNDELFYDDFSDIYFYSNRVSVLGAELVLNREFVENGIAHLSTFYNLLIPNHPEEYDNLIWTEKDCRWIDVEPIYVDEPFILEDGYANYYMLVFADIPHSP